MKLLLLLDNAPCPVLPPHSPAIIAVWDRGKVSAGHISIPMELNTRLLPIREELTAWVYTMGKTVVQRNADGDKTLEQTLRCGDELSMWWCSTLMEKHPKVTRNLFAALKLRTLEQLIDENTVTHVRLLTADPVLVGIMARFCAATGRVFSHAQPEAKAAKAHATIFPFLSATFNALRTPKTLIRTVYDRLPAPLTVVARFPAWLYAVRRHLPHTRTPSPVPTLQNRHATIATYFPNIDLALARKGRFRSRYWENLHDVLETQTTLRLHWLFLYFPSPQCTLAEAVRLRDGFQAKGESGTSFHFMEEFLDAARIRRALKRYARLMWASLRVERQARTLFTLPGSRMDLWPMLKKNWADSTRGWRALERCLMNEALKGYAAWSGSQDWLVYVQENCPWERLLTRAMHEAHPEGGPIYGAQHSTVRPTDFRYFEDPRLLEDPDLHTCMPDLWLCNGAGARDALLAVSGPLARPQTVLAERLRMVEALRYLYLEAPKPAPHDPDAPEMLAQNQTEPGHKSLLLVTSFFADETWEHLDTLAEAVREGVLEGWQVRIKAHPYLPVKERLALLFPHGNAPEEVDQPVGALLTPGVVVWASNSTTVALEAAFRGLPVLVQAADNDVDLCPLQGLPGVSLVRSGKDVAAALADPVAPHLPPDYLALDRALPRWKMLLKL